MKKRMVAGLLAAACLMGMCSCGSTDSSADSGKRDKQAKTASLDENAEIAYIDVWQRLYGMTSLSVYEDREEACQEMLKDWGDASPKEIIAASFYTLYLNDGKFDYYYCQDNVVTGMKLVSSGTVSKDTEGALAFSHQVIRSYDRDDDTLKQVIHYPDEAEQDYSRSDLMVYNQLKTGAETQGLYSTSAYNCARDKHRYLQNAYVWNAEKQDWCAGVRQEAFLPILSKGDYLVTQQQGYTLSTEQAGKSFSLYFSDSAFREDQPISYTITFDSDHTWSSDWQDGYHGKWELLDENLLLLYPPEDDSAYTSRDASIFYVDFTEDAVYTPLFVKSETMLPVVQQIVLEDEVK